MRAAILELPAHAHTEAQARRFDDRPAANESDLIPVGEACDTDIGVWMDADLELWLKGVVA